MGRIPLQKILCQRCQSLFPGNHGSGAALRLIGPVQILQLHHGFCSLNLCPELRRHFPLLLDGANDGFLPLLQVPKVTEPLIKASQLLIVHGAGFFLPVPRNKGDGVALVNQLYNGPALLRTDTQLPAENFNHVHNHFCLPVIIS